MFPLIPILEMGVITYYLWHSITFMLPQKGLDEETFSFVFFSLMRPLNGKTWDSSVDTSTWNVRLLTLCPLWCGDLQNQFSLNYTSYLIFWMVIILLTVKRHFLLVTLWFHWWDGAQLEGVHCCNYDVAGLSHVTYQLREGGREGGRMWKCVYHWPFSLIIVCLFVTILYVCFACIEYDAIIFCRSLFHTTYSLTLISAFIMQVEICIFVFDIMFVNGEQ